MGFRSWARQSSGYIAVGPKSGDIGYVVRGKRIESLRVYCERLADFGQAG